MKSLNLVLHILTLHCDGASELASRELDEPLSLADRLALHGHLISCRACREFRQQIRKIQEALSGREPTPAELLADHEALSSEARTRISQAMSQAGRGPRDADSSRSD